MVCFQVDEKLVVPLSSALVYGVRDRICSWGFLPASFLIIFRILFGLHVSFASVCLSGITLATVGLIDIVIYFLVLCFVGCAEEHSLEMLGAEFCLVPV